MAILTLRKAAEVAGVSRQTIYRYASSGKLSTVKMDDGTAGVDTAELVRVFGRLRQPETVAEAVTSDYERQEGDSLRQHRESTAVAALQAENEGLRREVAILEKQVEVSQDRENKLLGIIESQTRLLEHRTPLNEAPGAHRHFRWPVAIALAVLFTFAAYVGTLLIERQEQGPQMKPFPQPTPDQRETWHPENGG